MGFEQEGGIILVSIYILECKEDKYYVGKIRTNVWKRIKQHFDGKGAKWTQKYKPIEIIDIRRDKYDRYETIATLEMMREHGIDNVRGGAFSSMSLNQSQRHLAEYRLELRDDKPEGGLEFGKSKIKSPFRAVLLPHGTPPEATCRAMKKNGRGRCTKDSTGEDQICDMHRKSVNSSGGWRTITEEEMASPELIPKPVNRKKKRRGKRFSKAQCLGLTIEGRKCRRRGRYEYGYCHLHLDQIPDNNEEYNEQDSSKGPGLHDEGWLQEFEVEEIRMWKHFGMQPDWSLFEEKSDAWKKRWLN